MTADRSAALVAAADALSAAADALRAVALAAESRPDAPDRLLSVDEAADMLGVGRSMLYDLIAAARVRSVKVGRRRLVPSGAIAEYIAEARP